jgi:hypothetical protein
MISWELSSRRWFKCRTLFTSSSCWAHWKAWHAYFIHLTVNSGFSSLSMKPYFLSIFKISFDFRVTATLSGEIGTNWISSLHRRLQKIEQMEPDRCDRYKKNALKMQLNGIGSYNGIGRNISQILLKCRKSLFYNMIGSNYWSLGSLWRPNK